MKYLIDGYNLLFSLFESDGTFEQQREELLDFLDQYAASLHLNFTVIFDGSDDNFYTSYATHGILEVLFSSEGQSADELILQEVAASRSPQDLTIVTSDKKLLHKARHHRNHSLSVPQFLQFLSKKEKRAHPTSQPSDSQKELERLEKIFTQRYKNS